MPPRTPQRACEEDQPGIDRGSSVVHVIERRRRADADRPHVGWPGRWTRTCPASRCMLQTTGSPPRFSSSCRANSGTDSSSNFDSRTPARIRATELTTRPPIAATTIRPSHFRRQGADDNDGLANAYSTVNKVKESRRRRPVHLALDSGTRRPRTAAGPRAPEQHCREDRQRRDRGGPAMARTPSTTAPGSTPRLPAGVFRQLRHDVRTATPRGARPSSSAACSPAVVELKPERYPPVPPVPVDHRREDQQREQRGQIDPRRRSNPPRGRSAAPRDRRGTAPRCTSSAAPSTNPPNASQSAGRASGSLEGPHPPPLRPVYRAIAHAARSTRRRSRPCPGDDRPDTGERV